MLNEKAVDMLRHCEAESHCYDGIHGNCKRCNKRIALDMAIEALKADRPRGEWIVHGEPPWYVRECSKCGTKWHQWSGDSSPNYCGECGADMRGDTE